MNFEVEIISTDVEEKRGISKRTGQEYVIREQVGRMPINGELRNVRIPIEAGETAYEKGRYIIAPSSFYVNNFGSFSVGRVKLLDPKLAKAA